MKINSICNCIFKGSQSGEKTLPKKITPILASTCLYADVNQDLFVHSSKKLSEKEQENAIYNMGDMVLQLKDAGYSEKKPQEYNKLFKKLQGYCDKYNNNEDLSLKDINDFVDEFFKVL